eukprot:TRINITY_DN8444_c0_g1_i1.p1 TRINITY_DN8444_c0_g1~~TRINITY_DN8444_c0_g1_i1.p1  ORF type:complete len:307 (+),score=57.34 TRINITY_DN8444_c0_g1_i1:213-1133(+)
MQTEVWIGIAAAALIPAVIFALWRRRSHGSKKVDNKTSIYSIPSDDALSTSIDFSPAALYEDTKDKWIKPLTKLPVNVDIPRLARKMSIYDDSRNLLLDGSWLDLTPEEIEASPYKDQIPTNKSNTKLIQDVLQVLADQLGEDSTAIREEFGKMVKDNGGDTAGPFGNFLNRHMGDNSTVVKVLKACNQSIIAPSVVRLKLSIAPRLPFKDLRGAWRIQIHCLKSSVVVFHKKYETSWENFSTEEFQFSWQLRITFDKAMTTMKTVDVSITEIEFGKSVTDKRKKEVLEIMKQYYHPEENFRIVGS